MEPIDGMTREAARAQIAALKRRQDWLLFQNGLWGNDDARCDDYNHCADEIARLGLLYGGFTLAEVSDIPTLPTPQRKGA